MQIHYFLCNLKNIVSGAGFCSFFEAFFPLVVVKRCEKNIVFEVESSHCSVFFSNFEFAKFVFHVISLLLC